MIRKMLKWLRGGWWTCPFCQHFQHGGSVCDVCGTPRPGTHHYPRG